MARENPPHPCYTITHDWSGTPRGLQDMLDWVFPEFKTPSHEKRVAEGDYWGPIAAGIPVNRRPGDPPVTARYEIVIHRPATEVERRLRQAGVPTPTTTARDARLSYMEPDDLDVKRARRRRRRAI